MSCPWFMFKNLHSKKDMNCVIDEELPSVSPVENIETIKVRGRNGSLHRYLGTYDSFDYSITIQILNFDELEKVKQWLRGSGKLILCHEPGKYYEATVINAGNPLKFENQMDTFWLFTVVFELQPLKRQVREVVHSLNFGKNIFMNSGTEISFPKITVQSNGNGKDIEFLWKDGTYTISKPDYGTIEIDCELGLVTNEDGKYVKSKGRFPKIFPGRNELTLTNNGSFKDATILIRSLYR